MNRSSDDVAAELEELADTDVRLAEEATALATAHRTRVGDTRASYDFPDIVAFHRFYPPFPMRALSWIRIRRKVAALLPARRSQPK